MMNLWNFAKDACNSFDLRPNLPQRQHLSTATHTATCASTHAATHAATRCNTYCNTDWCGSYICDVWMATGRQHCNTLRNIAMCIATHCNAHYYRIYPCDFWSVIEGLLKCDWRWTMKHTLQHTTTYAATHSDTGHTRATCWVWLNVKSAGYPTTHCNIPCNTHCNIHCNTHWALQHTRQRTLHHRLIYDIPVRLAECGWM